MTLFSVSACARAAIRYWRTAGLSARIGITQPIRRRPMLCQRTVFHFKRGTMAIIPSQLAYLPIKDQQALLDWLGYHGDWHLKTAQRALKDGHTNLGQYNFWDMGDRDDWLFFHNQEHGDIANTYGLGAPPDL